MTKIVDHRSLQIAIMRRGVHICVGLPVLVMAVALLLRSKLGFLASPAANDESLRIIGFVMIALALGFIGGAFLLKRRIFTANSLKTKFSNQLDELEQSLVDSYTPILLVAASPAVLGLIFYFLGGDLDTYVLLSLFCPAGLMILKPRDSEIERLITEIHGEGV